MGLQRYDILAKPDGTWTGSVHFVEGELNRPLTWRKPKRIFVCSMGDLFHSRVQPFLWDEVFSRMVLTPRHTYCILTKRPERMRDVLTAPGMAERVLRRATSFPLPLHPTGKPAWPQWPPANVFVGTSIEDQPTADARLPFVIELASLGWRTMISAEPMLGPVDLTHWLEGWMCRKCGVTRLPMGEHGYCDCPLPDDPDEAQGDHRPGMIDWVICGGESGPHARPMHPDWARSLRDQCAAAGVPFFYKQSGEWAFGGGQATHALTSQGGLRPLTRGEDAHGAWPCSRVGKRAAGRMLDGVEHNAFPETRS